MVAPATIPEWLPPAILDEAQRIISTYFGADSELISRLATDKRMKPVWDELKKEIHKPAARSVLETCTSHAIAPRKAPIGLTERDAALTLFFWYAYAFAYMKPKIGKFSARDVLISRCQAEAAVLRLSAIRLWELDLSPVREFFGPAELSEQFNIHHDNVEEAAKFYAKLAGALLELKAAEAPLVVSKDYGNRHARGYVRMLAMEVRKLFGKTFIRSLARTASVALMKEISDVQVRKWTERLPKPAKSHD